MNRALGRKERVAWVSCVGEKGGAETLMIECLRELDRSRFEPSVIQLRPGPLTEMLRAIDVEVHDLRHLGNIIAALRALQGIEQVERSKG